MCNQKFVLAYIQESIYIYCRKSCIDCFVYSIFENSVCLCLTVNYGPREKTMSNYMNVQQVVKCPNVIRHIHFSKGETISVKGWLQYLIIALVADLKC